MLFWEALHSSTRLAFALAAHPPRRYAPQRPAYGEDEMTEVNVPTFDELMNPVIQALKELGESGTIEEINNKVRQHI